jgi:hypothetical protein
MVMTSYVVLPPGVSTCTVSPTLRAIRALPTGEFEEMRPLDGSAS